MNIIGSIIGTNISITQRGTSSQGPNLQKIRIGDQTFEVDGNLQVVVEVQGDVHGNVETMSGDVMVAGNAGDIETMSGSVRVVGRSGDIETMSGKVTVGKVD